MRDMLTTRDVKIGTFVSEFATPGIGYIVKAAGCDFVGFDMEHSGLEFETMRTLLRFAEVAGLATMVRPPSKQYQDIARTLDIGADSILAQLVGTAEEARELVVLDPHLMGLAALDDRGRRRALYALGADAWRRMCAAGSAGAENAADTATWNALAELPEQWSIPKFPLSGRDALALGLAPGPAIGALLAKVEAEWIKDDFALDAGGLRARLAERARDSR